MAMGKFPEAVYDFTYAIKLQENETDNKKQLSEYHRYAGQSYFEMCQYQEAYDHFDFAVENEQNAINYFNRGLARSKQGQYDIQKINAAIKDFGYAHKILTADKKEKSIEAYYCKYNLGINYRRLNTPKDFEESINALRLAIELFPEKSSCHNNLALSYFEKQDYESAVAYFNSAIKLEPQSNYFNNRGLTHYHMANYQQAFLDFEEALANNKTGDPTILFNRGNTYMSQRNFDLALKDYDAAFKRQPMNASYVHAKGKAYEAIASEI